MLDVNERTIEKNRGVINSFSQTGNTIQNDDRS